MVFYFRLLTLISLLLFKGKVYAGPCGSFTLLLFRIYFVGLFIHFQLILDVHVSIDFTLDCLCLFSFVCLLFIGLCFVYCSIVLVCFTVPLSVPFCFAILGLAIRALFRFVQSCFFWIDHPEAALCSI